MPKTKPAAKRRSLSQKNLAVRQEGPLGALLAEALHVPRTGGYDLTHGFHPYPGRFHPALPRLLLARLARPGQTVLDPFMGGGTTLVEALLQGVGCIGNDLNPVAVLVARERIRPRSHGAAHKVELAVRRIAAQVEALRREKNPPRYSLPGMSRVAPHYAPHLLAELMQWLRLIDALPQDPPSGAIRETLRAVFSSAAVKYSNQASDSVTESREPPTVAKGAVTRFLVKKSEELLRAQVILEQKLPRPHAAVRLLQEDARLLPSLGWGEADWILTSPPYPGVYDYAHQHALRMAWLGLDERAFLAGELAPRRQGRSPARGQERPDPGAAPPRESSWSGDLRDALVTLARVLRPGGGLFVVLGDWLDDGHPVDAAAVLGRTAQDKGWRLDSRASLRRETHGHAERKAFVRRGKWEHLLYFTR